MEANSTKDDMSQETADAIAAGDEALQKDDSQAALEHFQKALATLEDRGQQAASEATHCREQAATALFRLGK
jgi:hypothetical protein